MKIGKRIWRFFVKKCSGRGCDVGVNYDGHSRRLRRKERNLVALKAARD